VVVEVESDRNGWLVLSDRYYPGWRADINGKPARIERANVVVRAVAVPPGRHIVTFRFASTPLRAGAAISLLGWAAAASWWLAALVRSRRRPSAP
jgi:uncharacterized membrane protein YfhO